VLLERRNSKWEPESGSHILQKISGFERCAFRGAEFMTLYVAGLLGGKVGGRNTVLVDALTRRIPLVSDIPTIIFGADVTHPHPGEDSSPSIAAVSFS
jgi:hypothetical protein